MLSKLSFDVEDEVEEAPPQPLKKSKLGKDPSVDTSFLPDREREEKEREERERIKREWLEKQQKIKEEEMTIPYCYFDGTAKYKKSATVKKGSTVERFLLIAQQENCGELQ
jgi:protein FAM50